MRKTALSMLAICGLGWAQTATPKAHVDGRVLDLEGKPLGKATVALVGNNRAPGLPLPPVYTTRSGADGRFAFEDVEPNGYRMFVQRTGYLEFVYSQPDTGVVIRLAAGDRRSIEVKMTAQSFISGKITDEDGDPFPNARVAVYRVTRGSAPLTTNRTATTGADGSYSIADLSAGRYYLAAADPPSLAHAPNDQRDIRANPSGEDSYVTTYYPSVVDPSSATVIDVPAGREVRNMDIRVARARVFHVYGRVLDASGAPVPTATVSMSFRDLSDPMNSLHRTGAGEGVFEFNGLLPGTYSLQASAGSKDLLGVQKVTVGDHDVDDVAITLADRHSADIPLSIRIDGANPRQEEKIRSALGRFTLTASDGVSSNAMAQSKSDGTFLFRNIAAGTYFMGIGGPDGTYVKSIRFANQDITTRGLDTTAGAGPLEVVLSAHAAEVTGVLTSSTGQPVPGVAVTLWTPGLPTAGTLDQARSTATDAMGKFRFGNLRPGEYRIAAWEKIEAGLGNIPEFHARFDGRATAVKLSEDSREVVQPVLIRQEDVEAEAAKLQ